MNLKCPICEGSAHQDFSKHDYWIYTCETCQHQFVDIPNSPEHTQDVYDDSYFFEGGSGYLDYTSESDLLIAHGSRYGKLLSKYTQPGTVFDVGSAAGFILQGLVEHGWTGKGIEPNDKMASYAREQLQLDVETGIFEEYVPDSTYDLVTIVQVIAHFYDVRRAIEITSNLLDKDGLLLIETWDRASIPARILGSNWHEYSPPSVVNWFSADGLTQLVEQFGFTEVTRGRPSKWLNGKHAKSLLKYKLDTMTGGNLLYKMASIVPDKLPIPYPSLDLFWVLYQKK